MLWRTSSRRLLLAEVALEGVIDHPVDGRGGHHLHQVGCHALQYSGAVETQVWAGSMCSASAQLEAEAAHPEEASEAVRSQDGARRVPHRHWRYRCCLRLHAHP